MRDSHRQRLKLPIIGLIILATIFCLVLLSTANKQAPFFDDSNSIGNKSSKGDKIPPLKAPVGGNGGGQAALAYSDLVFMIIVPIPIDLKTMATIRNLVGSLHQLRTTPHSVPKIFVFALKKVSTEATEELSIWTKVYLHNVNEYLGLPILADSVQPWSTSERSEILRKILLKKVAEQEGHAMWVEFGFVFEPRKRALAMAVEKGEPADILNVYSNAQKDILVLGKKLISNGQIKVRDKSSDNVILEGYSANHKALQALSNAINCFHGKAICMNEPSPSTQTMIYGSPYGLANSTDGSMGCYLDIREDAIMNNMLHEEVDHVHEKMSMLRRNNTRLVAIGMPTTSKGLKEEEQPHFLKTFLNSLLNTVSAEELAKFDIVIYIGYDHHDPIFDDSTLRAHWRHEANQLIGEKPIFLKFIRFPMTRRVALLWNMLFVRAMAEGADYFYQVNDDLTLVTSGWLANFTSILDENNGFGVVGPSDQFHQFNCELLTQAMVTRVHYNIFTMLFPIELKDWKSDRWLTAVYGPSDTFCSVEIVANNGAAPTRYKHCPFLSWHIYLEAGMKKIAEWKTANLKNM